MLTLCLVIRDLIHPKKKLLQGKKFLCLFLSFACVNLCLEAKAVTLGLVYG
jgi:hypothetical protein